MIGIYSIISPTDKMYIGQSWNVEKRLLAYKRLDCRKQPKIYRSLVKHGVDSHVFSILKGLPEITTQKQLDFWEDYVICSFRRLGVVMLNIKSGGSGGRMSEETKLKLSKAKMGVPRGYFLGSLNPYYGKKHTLEIRAKMSMANRGNKVGARNGRARTVIQYDFQMNIIKEYTTLTLAALETKASRQGISDVVNGRSKTAGGFIWKYKTQAA